MQWLIGWFKHERIPKNPKESQIFSAIAKNLNKWSTHWLIQPQINSKDIISYIINQLDDARVEKMWKNPKESQIFSVIAKNLNKWSSHWLIQPQINSKDIIYYIINQLDDAKVEKMWKNPEKRNRQLEFHLNKSMKEESGKPASNYSSENMNCFVYFFWKR